MFGCLLLSTIGILLVLEQKAPSPICFYVEHEFREASLGGVQFESHRETLMLMLEKI